MDYIIVQPDGEPDIDFSPADFFEQLKIKWPDVKIQDKPLTDRGLLSHYWYRYINDRDFEGFILDYGKGVVITTASINDAVEFALWFRGIIPANKQLMMCDKQWAVDIILTSVTTANEIIDVFSGIDPQ